MISDVAIEQVYMAIEHDSISGFEDQMNKCTNFDLSFNRTDVLYSMFELQMLLN